MPELDRSYVMWVFDRILSMHVHRIEYDFLEPTERWGDYIYETLFVPIKHKKVSVQSGVFVESVSGVSRIAFFEYDNASSMPFFLKFSEPKPIPLEISSEYSSLGYFAKPFCLLDYFVTTPHLVLCDHPVWHELRNAVIAHNKKREKAEEARTRFGEYVRKFCDYYNDINEAVAAWPAFKFLLPESLQTKEFVFDGTPKPLPDGVDIAELTAIITRAKLMEV